MFLPFTRVQFQISVFIFLYGLVLLHLFCGAYIRIHAFHFQCLFTHVISSYAVHLFVTFVFSFLKCLFTYTMSWSRKDWNSLPLWYIKKEKLPYNVHSQSTLIHNFSLVLIISYLCSSVLTFDDDVFDFCLWNRSRCRLLYPIQVDTKKSSFLNWCL